LAPLSACHLVRTLLNGAGPDDQVTAAISVYHSEVIKS